MDSKARLFGMKKIWDPAPHNPMTGPVHYRNSRVDAIEGKSAEFLVLPSGGDASCEGLFWHDKYDAGQLRYLA